MNDGIRSLGLVCISTTTFSDVDILFTKCLHFAPQTGELLQNSYFFAKNFINKKKKKKLYFAKNFIAKNQLYGWSMLRCAASTSGHNNGVQKHIKDQYSSAIYIHCFLQKGNCSEEAPRSGERNVNIL